MTDGPELDAVVGPLEAPSPLQALRVRRLEELPRRDLEAAARRLQALLRPGGRLVATGRRGGRRVARVLRHYFEGGVPGPRERFRWVRSARVPGGWRIEAWRRGPRLTAGHFDNIAEEYRDEMPSHVVDHFLERKVAAIAEAVAPLAPRRILDLGCGVGEYARAVAQRTAATVVAVDAARGAVAVASRQGGGAYAAADAQRLPFADGAFDAAYTINTLHHLKRGEQAVALGELRRVLRPGGLLLVLEINVRNPAFRLYMRHVFPRTRRIDRGDEEFLDPRRLPVPGGLRVEGVAYSSFLPDFVPRWALRPARAVESALERTPLRAWSIHYAVRLRAVEPGA